MKEEPEGRVFETCHDELFWPSYSLGNADLKAPRCEIFSILKLFNHYPFEPKKIWQPVSVSVNHVMTHQFIHSDGGTKRFNSAC